MSSKRNRAKTSPKILPACHSFVSKHLIKHYHIFYNTQQLCTGPTTTDPKQSPFTSDNQAIFRRTKPSSRRAAPDFSASHEQVNISEILLNKHYLENNILTPCIKPHLFPPHFHCFQFSPSESTRATEPRHPLTAAHEAIPSQLLSSDGFL